jgi:hypothetical protein
MPDIGSSCGFVRPCGVQAAFGYPALWMLHVARGKLVDQDPHCGGSVIVLSDESSR